MVEVVPLSLGVVQILVQIGAFYLAYRLTRITGVFLAWSLVMIALILMTVRRLTALLIEIGSIPAFAGSIAFVDRILLPFSISILLLLAMYRLVKTFEGQLKKS